MFKKQIFAQVGVFLLLGLNVAAYWFLWPNYHNVSSNEGRAPTQDKGTARLVPEAPAPTTPPKEIASSSLKDAVPLSIPVSASQVEPRAAPERETISKLVDQIEKDKTPMPLVTLPLEPSQAFPLLDVNKLGNDEKSAAPKPLPVLPAVPLQIESPVQPIAAASALTPKMQPSPWQLNMEMVGTRTQLFAKLKQHGNSNVVTEFKILCDRVEMKSPGGELQALGKVTVVGGGLNASCQRLILPIQETRLVFEDQAQIAHDGVAGSSLRGDRITWELPVRAAPALPMNEFRPAGILPPALGGPK